MKSRLFFIGQIQCCQLVKVKWEFSSQLKRRKNPILLKEEQRFFLTERREFRVFLLVCFNITFKEILLLDFVLFSNIIGSPIWGSAETLSFRHRYSTYVKAARRRQNLQFIQNLKKEAMFRIARLMEVKITTLNFGVVDLPLNCLSLI